ncbi:acyl-CoA thioesterase [Piscinibacter sp.]|uniref:acyl-CoA thioesterase n=1 Tax=Piscinibacter sp. TaxID=1903157 RepID=UPI0039E6062C
MLRTTEPPRCDELTLTELVLPEQANHYGTLFGPNALALLGKAAFLVATRYARQAIVMAAANRIEFLQPVPVGAVLKLSARIARTGRSSLTARVVGYLDSEQGPAADAVLRGDFEMVAVDARGRPTPLQTPPNRRLP